MPSATPPRDVSVSWPVHTCGARHAENADCPTLDTWLVAEPGGRRDVVVKLRRRTS